jgi:hypothetical protein
MFCFSKRELELIRVKKGNESHNNGRIGKKHVRRQRGGSVYEEVERKP